MLKALKITTNKIKVALYVYLYTYKVKNIKEGKHSLIIIHLDMVLLQCQAYF